MNLMNVRVESECSLGTRDGKASAFLH